MLLIMTLLLFFHHCWRVGIEKEEIPDDLPPVFATNSRPVKKKVPIRI
jgi:hypothetical protein